MMTSLLDNSDALCIFMLVAGFLKGHDLMNQNLPSFSCLKKITSIMSFPFILSTYADLSSVWSTQGKKFGITVLKLDSVWKLPRRASFDTIKSDAKNYIAFANQKNLLI